MYYRDHREEAQVRWYESFDEKTMTATMWVETDDGDEESLSGPCKYEVCPTCHGNGKHVNPSIDAHGLSREAFAEDPRFELDYFSGTYDVTCYGCGGKRVVPVPRKTEHKALVEERVREELEYRRECAMERMMGA